ncbi:hypothetical protein GBAR_LOCUS16247, partial [Geodia barretti]
MGVGNLLFLLAALLRVARPDLLACCSNANSDQLCHSICTA